MAGFQLAGPAADVSKILYGENRKSYQSPNAQYNNSGAARFLTVRCSEYVLLDVMKLIWALDNSYDQQTEVITVRLSKTHCSPYKFLKIRPAKKWAIWGTFGPKFPVFLLVYGQ